MAGVEGIPRASGTINRDASRSLQAGLVAIALVGLTIAMFGPWFYLSVGYILLAGSGIAAVLGLWWGDRVVHAAPSLGLHRERRDARIGGVFSLVALLFVLSYTGFVFLLLVLWPAVLILGLVIWSIHRARVAEVARGAVRT